MKILFLHGWHSDPGGVKSTFLAQHGHTVIDPTLSDEDFDEAVGIAEAEFDRHQQQIVVAESRGGTVAMNIKSGDAKLVLLCPAWKNFGMEKRVKPGTVILHCRADDMIPFADGEQLVKNSGATLIEVGSDHRLMTVLVGQTPFTLQSTSLSQDQDASRPFPSPKPAHSPSRFAGTPTWRSARSP